MFSSLFALCPPQANELLGLGPGEVFVQRNIGNIVNHKDFNCMSCLEYAIKGLQVRHIMVCGHYGCGAVSPGQGGRAVWPGLQGGPCLARQPCLAGRTQQWTAHGRFIMPCSQLDASSGSASSCTATAAVAGQAWSQLALQ
jgi:hypothetical protein